jgi:hypothetical protein
VACDGGGARRWSGRRDAAVGAPPRRRVVLAGGVSDADLGGWAIGVVDDDDDSDHRRSSGVTEDRLWAMVRWCSEAAASTVGGRPVVGRAEGREETTDNSDSMVDRRSAAVRLLPPSYKECHFSNSKSQTNLSLKTYI